MNVLAVVAHPDDEVLGCGGTLYRLSQAGHSVYAAVLCGDAEARVDRPANFGSYAAEAARLVGVQEALYLDFPNIRFNVIPHIELVQAIEEAIVRFRAEWIFTHHPSDLNVDHRVCYEATTAAAMLPQRQSRDLPTSMVRRIMLCEIPSSTDWAPPSASVPFQPNAFMDISSTIDQKLAALKYFQGAMKPFPHSRSLENVRHLAYLRGAAVGLEAAEAFVTIRDLL